MASSARPRARPSFLGLYWSRVTRPAARLSRPDAITGDPFSASGRIDRTLLIRCQIRTVIRIDDHRDCEYAGVGEDLEVDSQFPPSETATEWRC